MAPFRQLGFFDRLVHQGQDIAGMVKKHRPRRRQIDAAALALEQPDAKLLFKLLNLPCQRGLRDMQPQCGPAEMHFLRKDDKILEMPELDVRLRHLSTLCWPRHFFGEASSMRPTLPASGQAASAT